MGNFLGYIFRALAVLVVVCGLAAWPFHALAGTDGLVSLAVAAAVSFLGVVVGRLPHLFFRKGPDALLNAAMAGLGVRLLFTVALAAVVLLLTGLPLVPLAIALVLTYSALLIHEVRDLLIQAKAMETSMPDGRDAQPDGSANDCTPDPKGAPTQ